MVDGFDGVTFEQLTAAFFKPPRIVRIGYSHTTAEGGSVIISHVELWPWRVVVAGCRTRRREDLDALMMRPRPHQPKPPPSASARDVSNTASVLGVVYGAVNDGDGREDDVRRWRERVEAEQLWYSHWEMRDDADTAYWFVGSPRQERERVENFAIERHPAPPPEASRLTIATPFAEEIHIALHNGHVDIVQDHGDTSPAAEPTR